jgi:hypothetical protein
VEVPGRLFQQRAGNLLIHVPLHPLRHARGR